MVCLTREREKISLLTDRQRVSASYVLRDKTRLSEPQPNPGESLRSQRPKIPAIIVAGRHFGGLHKKPLMSADEHVILLSSTRVIFSVSVRTLFPISPRSSVALLLTKPRRYTILSIEAHYLSLGPDYKFPLSCFSS